VTHCEDLVVIARGQYRATVPEPLQLRNLIPVTYGPPVFHNNLSQDLKARYPSRIGVEGRQASTTEDGMREEGLTFLFRN